MRELLIVLWSLGLLFFIWEFIVAKSLPGRYAKAKPSSFRIADVLFGVTVVLTLIYLVQT